MKRFLFFYPGALGDVLLAAPVFQSIREQFSGARIEFVGSYAQIELLHALNLIDRGLSLDDRDFLPLFGEDNFPENLLNFFRSFDAIVFWISNFQLSIKDVPFIVANPRPEPHPPIHHAQYLYNSVQSFFNLPSWDVTSFYMRNFQTDRSLKSPMLLVHAGSGSPKKNWPLGNFVALARRWKEKYAGNVTFLFGPADADVRGKFKRSVPAWEFSIIDSPDFENLVKLIAAADFYLGNDSGISHLAGLLNKKGFVFFRTTNPKIWGPLGEKLYPVVIH